MRIFNDYAELRKAYDDGSFRHSHEYSPAGFVCCDCKQVIAFTMEGITTDYGTTHDRAEMFCYSCGAERCKRDLVKSGKGILYLTQERHSTFAGYVSDWRENINHRAALRGDVTT